MLKNFLRDENGQGMVEYGLIIALIAVVVVVALKALGTSVNGIFTTTKENLDGATAPAAGSEAGGATD